MVDLLGVDLKEHGVAVSEIPAAVLEKFVWEAYRRAADGEDDKRARYGRFYEEIERVAAEIAKGLDGESDVDPSVKKILEFHRLL